MIRQMGQGTVCQGKLRCDGDGYGRQGGSRHLTVWSDEIWPDKTWQMWLVAFWNGRVNWDMARQGMAVEAGLCPVSCDKVCSVVVRPDMAD